MIARVLLVIAASILSGSILYPLGSISANTGLAPTCSTTFTDAANVIGVTITSSRGPILYAFNTKCIAAVHEFVAVPYGEPI